jgi:serine/threonine protein kinase
LNRLSKENELPLKTKKNEFPSLRQKPFQIKGDPRGLRLQPSQTKNNLPRILDMKPGVENDKDKFKRKYKLIEKLGEGSHSSVYLCVSRSTNKKYAAKMIPKKQIKTKEKLKSLKVDNNTKFKF